MRISSLALACGLALSPFAITAAPLDLKSFPDRAKAAVPQAQAGAVDCERTTDEGQPGMTCKLMRMDGQLLILQLGAEPRSMYEQNVGDAVPGNPAVKTVALPGGWKGLLAAPAESGDLYLSAVHPQRSEAIGVVLIGAAQDDPLATAEGMTALASRLLGFPAKLPGEGQTPAASGDAPKAAGIVGSCRFADQMCIEFADIAGKVAITELAKGCTDGGIWSRQPCERGGMGGGCRATEAGPGYSSTNTTWWSAGSPMLAMMKQGCEGEWIAP